MYKFSLPELIGLSLVLSLTPFTILYLVVRQRYRQTHIEIVRKLVEKHRQEFEDMIHKINHEGPIPDSATTRGLIVLILSAMTRSIDSLQKLYEKQEWNTKEIITELSGIQNVELVILYRKLQDFTDSVHKVLKDYDHLQWSEKDKPKGDGRL